MKTADRGFTLLEIMIVLVIIVSVIAIGSRGFLSSTSSEIKSIVRKISVLTREVHNQARLKGNTYRLVINMDDERGHSYWVESGTGTILFQSKDQEDRQKQILEDQQSRGEEVKASFAPDTRVLKEPVKLGRNLFFESVEKGARKEIVTSGVAYVHFLPQGLVEEVAIHLTNRKTLNWTLVIHPITGKARIFDQKISLEQARLQ